MDAGEVNRHVAGKMHLAQGTDDPVTALTDVCGIRADDGPGPDLALFARVREYESKDLVRVVGEGEAVRVRAMGHGYFLLPRSDLADYLGAFAWTEAETQEEYARVGIERGDARELDTAVYDAIPPEGGTAAEIRGTIDNSLLGMVKGRGQRTPRSTLSVALEVLSRRGLVAVHRDAPVRDLLPLEYNASMREVMKPNRYFRLDQRLPSRLRRTARAKARERVVRRFVRRFGPVTERDVATWSGLGMDEVREVRKKLGKALTEVRIARVPGVHLIDRDDEMNVEGGDEVTFLPVGDAYPLGLDTAPRLVPKRDWLIARSWPTVFVGGELAAVWRYSRLGRTFRLIVTPLPRWGSAEKQRVTEAAYRWSRHLAPGTEVSVGWAPELYEKLRPGAV